MALNSLHLVDSGLQAAFANAGVFTSLNAALEGEHIRMALIGDSIINNNTAGATDPVQDSIGYGMLRVWEVPLSGLLSGSNDPGSWWQWSASSAAVLAGTNDDRGYLIPTDNDPLGTHSLDNYGSRITREYEFTADVVAASAINTFKMLNGLGDFWDADWWQGGEAISTGWLIYAFASTVLELDIVAHGTTLDTTSISNIHLLPTGWNLMLGPADRVSTAGGDMRIAIRCDGVLDETGKFGVFGGGKMWIPTKDGWELYACGIGGAHPHSWSDEDMISTAQFVRFFGTAGVDANVFAYMLGANGSGMTKTEIINLIEKAHAANNDCVVLFLAQYGTEASISQAQALEIVANIEGVAANGTANVPPPRIAFINTPLLLGDTLDGLAGGNLIDPIHPTRLGCTVLATAWWDEIVAATEPSVGSPRWDRSRHRSRSR